MAHSFRGEVRVGRKPLVGGLAFAAVLGATACSALFDENDLNDGSGSAGRGGQAGAGGKSGASGAAGAGLGGRAGAGAGGMGGSGGSGGSAGSAGSGGLGGGGAGGAGGGVADSPYAKLVLGALPSLYFRLEEPPGSSTIVSIAQEKGTLDAQGMPTFGLDGIVREPGNVGVRLSGNDAFSGGDATFFPDGNGAFTIEAWVLPDFPPETPFCVASLAGFEGASAALALTPEGLTLRLEGANGGETIVLEETFDVGRAAYVAASYNGTALQLCKGNDDGSAICSEFTPGSAFPDDFFQITLGDGPKGGCPFVGLLDDVALYPFDLPPLLLLNHHQVGFAILPDEGLLPGR